jgi:A118 family predicted phage portal protein
LKNVFEVLKKEGYECSTDLQNYYKEIDQWRYWWQGYLPEFHKYLTSNVRNELTEVERQKLKMAKKVCEDWANLLLTDKTLIIVDETVDVGTDEEDDSVKNKVNESQVFLSGDDTEQQGGVLGLSKFWKNGNRSIEKSMALGTIAFILNLHKPAYDRNNKVLSAESVKIKYIKDAANIIPLSYDDTGIIECAFASSKTIKGKSYLYLQIMTQIKEGYQIENIYYLLENGSYSKCDETPTGEVKSYILPAKPFFIFSPNIENNISDVPLGVSVYANALDQLKGCDLAFDNLYNDFLLGRKKVHVTEDLISTGKVLKTDSEGKTMKDKNGKPIYETKPLAGDAIEQSLYVNVGKRGPDEKRFFEEYNPQLRVEENKNGIQFFLNLLSSKVGLGQGRYRFDFQTMNTATEVKASNKDLTESVWKQRVALTDVLTEMTSAILKIGKEMCGKNVNPDAKITIKFDDTMFADEEAQRMRDLQEVRDNIMQRWEYRVKWYGEDEKKAKEMASQEEYGEEEYN